MRIGFSTGVDRLASPRPLSIPSRLLLEGGDFALLESGDKILMEA